MGDCYISIQTFLMTTLRGDKSDGQRPRNGVRRSEAYREMGEGWPWDVDCMMMGQDGETEVPTKHDENCKTPRT